MAAYKSGAFVRSKSGASKSRPLWAAHTRIGNVWEYPPGVLVNYPEILFRSNRILVFRVSFVAPGISPCCLAHKFERYD